MFFDRWIRSIVFVFVGLGLLMTAGCGGCRDDAKKDKKTLKEELKKKLARKEDFENLDAVALPGIFPQPKPLQTGDREEDIRIRKQFDAANRRRRDSNKTKLGHWSSIQLSLIANNFDSGGQLSASSVSQSGKPVRVPGTDYFFSTTRPISLPKGEWKQFESIVFLPRRETKTLNATLNFSIKSNGIDLFRPLNQSARLLHPFEYNFVILSNRPEAYNYIAMSDVVQIKESNYGIDFPSLFNVISSRNGDPVPLARQSLAWTTIAYVLWDDFGAEQLSTDQQTALLDWIHFGGQLIISGPDSLDKLKSSFISDFLPAKSKASRQLRNSDFADINQFWSVPVAKNRREQRELVVSDRAPLLGIEFDVHPESRFVEGTGKLVVERRVGRGRIVVTGFSLDDTPIRKWRSLSSFINGCLMRRPSREFVENDFPLTYKFKDGDSSIFDPLVGSSLRYLSRDLGQFGTQGQRWLDKPVPDPFNGANFGNFDPASTFAEAFESGSSATKRNQKDVWRFGGFNDDAQSGVGGWNDASGISIAARDTLKEAAGISPPSSKFVFKMLAVYLFVLVPLNWLVFRLMGKVEWAWAAAPVIAIVGAVFVVKLASLDIGFVRSNNQLALVEVYGGYSRAHVAEYSALYTSLSTNYNVELDNSAAQSLPFAPNLSDRHKIAERPSQVSLNRSVGNRIENFQVQSNTTGMLHTEYMVDMGGTISLDNDTDGSWAINNTTRFDLRSAAVLRRDSARTYSLAEIGSLPAGVENIELEWQPVKESQLSDFWLKNDEFVSPGHVLDEIWDGRELRSTVSIAEFQKMKKIAEFLGPFNQAASEFLELPIETVAAVQISKTQLDAILKRVRSHSNIDVNVSQMFKNIMDELELEIGESRLIAVTNQAIGSTEFDPSSTQTYQSSLFVVHLQKGDLPAAARDANALADFAMNSNLDLEQGAKKINDNLDLEDGPDRDDRE